VQYLRRLSLWACRPWTIGGMNRSLKSTRDIIGIVFALNG
jgi:hypothetical protein